MMMNKEYVVAFAKKLLAIDSPTGYTKKPSTSLKKKQSDSDIRQNVITKAIYGSM